MKYQYKLDEMRHGILGPKLEEVMAPLSEIAKELQWQIGFLWGTNKQTATWSVRELEAKIGANENAMPISWEQLHRIAEGLDQTIDIMLWGRSRLGRVVVTIECVDSSYWLIGTDVKEVAAVFDKHFGEFRVTCPNP